MHPGLGNWPIMLWSDFLGCFQEVSRLGLRLEKFRIAVLAIVKRLKMAKMSDLRKI